MSEDSLDDVLIEDNTLFNKIEYAGLWIRVRASIIDSIIMIPILILSFYNILALKSMVLMFVLTIVASLYKPLLEWRYGATLGKMVVKIRVVNEKMNYLTLGQAFGRYIPWGITQVLSLITYYYLFSSSNFQNIDSLISLEELNQSSPIETTSAVYNFIFFIIVGSLIFDKRKQGFHDKIALTFCIKT